jgi:hypothetical protein
MNRVDKGTAGMMMGGLVGGGVVMAMVGSGSPDPQVTSVLPPIGAAMIAAGTLVLVQAVSLDGPRAVVVGGSLVIAGILMAMIGSVVTDVAASASVVPIGGALVTAGIVSLVSGTAAVGSRVASVR